MYIQQIQTQHMIYTLFSIINDILKKKCGLHVHLNMYHIAYMLCSCLATCIQGLKSWPEPRCWSLVSLRQCRQCYIDARCVLKEEKREGKEEPRKNVSVGVKGRGRRGVEEEKEELRQGLICQFQRDFKKSKRYRCNFSAKEEPTPREEEPCIPWENDVMPKVFTRWRICEIKMQCWWFLSNNRSLKGARMEKGGRREGFMCVPLCEG